MLPNILTGWWISFIAGFVNAKKARAIKNDLNNRKPSKKEKELAEEAWFEFRKHFIYIRNDYILYWNTKIYKDGKTRSEVYNWSPSEFKLTNKENENLQKTYRELYNDILFNSQERVSKDTLLLLPHQIKSHVDNIWFKIYSKKYCCNSPKC